jgi:hypothetical protein
LPDHGNTRLRIDSVDLCFLGNDVPGAAVFGWTGTSLPACRASLAFAAWAAWAGRAIGLEFDMVISFEMVV